MFKYFVAHLHSLSPNYSMDYVVLGISCINFIVPSLSFNKCLFKVNEDVSNHQLYNEARLYFNCEYDRTNPLTKKKAMKKWFDFQKEQGLIGQEEAEKMKADQENEDNHDMINNVFNNVIHQNHANFTESQV